ncbi:MAG TPA: NAD(P)-dependent oxidoreductase [Geminicoccaceae bacterium]|nr:NAD(P)-dependent oxidoreductase [Geminicoccaceae bacterium]
MAESIAVVGLGGMGAGAAQRLLDQGYRVRVWNRSAAKAAPLVERGAEAARSPGEAAGGAGIVITFLADDRALEEVVLGPDGVAAGLGEGAVHLSMSTIAPATARRLAEAHRETGAALVAAPVFGRPDAAASGQLWIVTSGPSAAKERVRPVLEALGQGVRDFGEDPEGAYIVKLAGNFLIAAASEAMAEAYTLGEKCGLDRMQLAEFFGASLFPSRIYQNYGKAIAEHRYEPPGFKLRLGLKDLRLVLGTADANQMPMPLASLLHDRFLALAAQGHGEIDWTAIGLGVAREAGVGPRSS